MGGSSPSHSPPPRLTAALRGGLGPHPLLRGAGSPHSAAQTPPLPLTALVRHSWVSSRLGEPGRARHLEERGRWPGQGSGQAAGEELWGPRCQAAPEQGRRAGWPGTDWVTAGAGALGARGRWELPQALCPASVLPLPAHAHGPGPLHTLCGCLPGAPRHSGRCGFSMAGWPSAGSCSKPRGRGQRLPAPGMAPGSGATPPTASVCAAGWGGVWCLQGSGADR